MEPEALYPELEASEQILDLLPFPAVLWSRDRNPYVLNRSLRRLFGFAEIDAPNHFFHHWRACIHPEDRQSFDSAWHQIDSGETDTCCQYRFFPRPKEFPIPIREFLFSSSRPAWPSRSVWSLYVEDKGPRNEGMERTPIGELVKGLTHEIGNNLQAIRGELDLLTIAGTLPRNRASTIFRDLERIRALTWEATDYLSPRAIEKNWQNPSELISAVIRKSRLRLAQRGIHVSSTIDEPLPYIFLDRQFCSALERVIDFSATIQPRGGAVKIKVAANNINDKLYLEMRVINESPTRLELEENVLFRPYLKVNNRQLGLSLTMAQQILRDHFGNIIFRKTEPNIGIFVIRIKGTLNPEASR